MALQVNSDNYQKALVGQMAWEGVATSTILFFKAVYPIILMSASMTQAQMAEAAGYTQQAAQLHCKVLEDKGYFSRINYRAWKLAENPLHDPFFRLVLRSMDYA